MRLAVIISILAAVHAQDMTKTRTVYYATTISATTVITSNSYTITEATVERTELPSVELIITSVVPNATGLHNSSLPHYTPVPSMHPMPTNYENCGIRTRARGLFLGGILAIGALL